MMKTDEEEEDIDDVMERGKVKETPVMAENFFSKQYDNQLSDTIQYLIIKMNISEIEADSRSIRYHENSLPSLGDTSQG